MPANDPYDVFGFDDARSLRDLLADFEVVGRGEYAALISANQVDSDVRDNVRAALLAAKLNLASVDYTKKKYGKEDAPGLETESLPPVKRYVRAYYACMHYIETMHAKMSSMNEETRHWGAFAASVALTRLKYSFFSAHLLYQLGHKYEAHAVSRQIFEQLAWAYAASNLGNLDEIKRLVTTKCVTNLRKIDPPRLGKLYGMLNLKVHLDSRSHTDFLRIEDGVTVVRHTHSDYSEYAWVMLQLADLFGVVWELSQALYIQDFEATELSNGIRSIREDRPFIAVMRHHLSELKPENEAFDTAPTETVEPTKI